MIDRERLLVELVDEAGRAIGSCSVAEAHTAPGRRHRAFSVLLRDDSGRLLLQRRAANKTRFASRWSNSCCGHPKPGQDLREAATARVTEELGIPADRLSPLREAGTFGYRAADPASGRVEYEWDHVLVGVLAADGGSIPAPDPAEVAECAWLSRDELRAAMAANPDDYTPWLADVLRVAGSVPR